MLPTPDLAWAQHLGNLLLRALSFLLAERGTTVVSVIIAAAVTLVSLIPVFWSFLGRIRRDGFRQAAKASLKPRTLALIAIWTVVFIWAVATVIYRDHMDLVADKDAKQATIQELNGKVLDLERKLKLSALPPRTPIPKLYYEDREHVDRELNGAKITLGLNPDSKSCKIMHVWATMPQAPADSFAVCGVWMKKPNDAASVTAFALYIDLSEEVTDRNQACRRSYEKPEPGYKVALVCQGWPTPSLNRWTLPAFYGMPIPTTDTRVRVRFEYGNNRRAEATFILRPTERG